MELLCNSSINRISVLEENIFKTNLANLHLKIDNVYNDLKRKSSNIDDCLNDVHNIRNQIFKTIKNANEVESAKRKSLESKLEELEKEVESLKCIQ